MHTPWGGSDYSKKYASGIMFYGTPSHGGIHLSPKRMKQLPEAFKAFGPWFEEDCEFYIVVVSFPQFFPDIPIEDAKASLRDYFPNEYEAFFGETIPEGKSYAKDRRLFEAWHVNDYVSRAAFGTWAEGVPEGMVGVFAQRTVDGDPAYFLIPAEEYESSRSRYGFVVDPARHQRIPGPLGASKKIAAG